MTQDQGGWRAISRLTSSDGSPSTRRPSRSFGSTSSGGLVALPRLGIEWPEGAYLFSVSPDGSTFATPDSVTQRYDRMVTRLGIDTTLHKLRHYSATELIAAGVDPRTVAGRLGHGGGGTTTLRTYTAWVSESDQRAARSLGAGMPQRPAEVDETALIRDEPRHPYQVVAAAVASRIDAGALLPGSSAPAAADLADEQTYRLRRPSGRYDCSPSGAYSPAATGTRSSSQHRLRVRPYRNRR